MTPKKDTFSGGLVGAIIIVVILAGLSAAWDQFSTADIWTQLFILACSVAGGSGVYWMLRAMWSDK